MLVFLNIDCLLDRTATATALPAATEGVEPIGLPGFESALEAWPQMRVVITGERRYRMTIEQLRAPFAPPYRPRVIATTLLYGALARGAAPTREQEILDWLRHADALHADWLALDHRSDDFQAHADRLLACSPFDRWSLERLHARLLQRTAGRVAPVLQSNAGPEPRPQPVTAGPVIHGERSLVRSSSRAGSAG